MPADGYRHMLCVEAAAIDAPVLLAPRGRWQAAQRFEQLVASAAAHPGA
jgi:glucose-6-phosphate 1-epimerase